MIRPDTLSYIRRVVDPELHILRETRDALARQLALRVRDQEDMARLHASAMADMSRMARWILVSEGMGARMGKQAALRLTTVATYTNGGHA